MDRFFTAVSEGDLQTAVQIGSKSKFYVVRALGYALSHKETSLANALLYAQAKELKRYQRGVSVLDTVITLAPLLGLLGTVTGMMGSFSIIGGELSSPGAITGGIAEALIATAFGLGIAITALLPFNFLNTKTELARHELEAAATQLELIVGPRAADSAAAKAVAHGDMNARATNGTTASRSDRAHTSSVEPLAAREDLERQLSELRAALDQRSVELQRLVSRERVSREAAIHMHSSER
jgi:biopolymer transport protein ExbB